MYKTINKAYYIQFFWLPVKCPWLPLRLAS